jgi:hypothetical protein
MIGTLAATRSQPPFPPPPKKGLKEEEKIGCMPSEIQDYFSQANVCRCLDTSCGSVNSLVPER